MIVNRPLSACGVASSSAGEDCICIQFCIVNRCEVAADRNGPRRCVADDRGDEDAGAAGCADGLVADAPRGIAAGGRAIAGEATGAGAASEATAAGAADSAAGAESGTGATSTGGASAAEGASAA